MRKGFKKLLSFATAALMTAGALSLAACGGTFTPPKGMPSDGDPVSNGGFVVGKGEYYYFINGVESYTSDNTYGVPVKGSLQRIKKDDVGNKENKAETVIPSLMVAGDYNAGLFIYGDRIYYATPNNVGDTSGTVQSGYLDFKSAKLDGTDIRDIYRVSSNTTPYRFVQAGEDVYLVYVESNDIYSVNTGTKERTMLADNTTSYVFNRSDVTDPYVYYTMTVTDQLDTDNSVSYSDYNQVYRVRADAKEAPYSYEFDEEYVKNELDGAEPYTNLGEIVLDGRSSYDSKTQFNHSETEPGIESHTYTLQTYENGGLYYVDTPGLATGSVGSADKLLYLSADKITSEWDSVAVNASETETDVVANSSNRSNASATALFYLAEDGSHHYLYVSGNSIYRADVKTDRSGETETKGNLAVAFDVSGATLVSLDRTTHDKYDYVYFTRSNGAGRSVERAVFNGDPGVYDNLQEDGSDPEPYKSVKVLDLEHASGWYQFELIGTDLFYADADNEVASASYNYIATVSLANGEGKLMDNVELKAFTDKYNSVMSTDAKVGLVAKLNANSNSKLSTAVKYYFYTGERQAFIDNIDEAVNAGKKDTYLYSYAEQDAFDAFATGGGYTQDDGAVLFAEGDYKDEAGVSYRVRSYFITEIGSVKEEDVTARSDYWKSTLQHYTEPAEESEGVPVWGWVLIGIGIAFVVLCIVTVCLGVSIYKKNKPAAPKKERMAVDTTDDRSVDVYASEESAETEESTEELAETEEPAEAEASEPAEEPVETPVEAPASDGGAGEDDGAPKE